MSENKKNTFKKWVFLVSLLFLTIAIFTPISQSQAVENQINIDNKTNSSSAEYEDFCIRIHRILRIDEIDPMGGSADWQLRMYVNGVKKVYECEGDDIILDKNFIWDDIIQEGMKFVDIKMELLELDLIWHDIADISAYIDEDYEEGDYDNTDDFNSHRPAVFKRTYNLVTEEWEPEDDDNDYLNTDYQPPLTWYITSGNYDGSTTVDENDAAIWFDVSVGNTPPYAPEMPSGPTFGWIENVYEFSTTSYDDDGDQIKFAWDWEGDGDIDEVTEFYDSWEECIKPHYWIYGQIFYMKVMAIDSRGMCSDWSEPLKVRINAPGGINGVEVEEWSLGHAYCLYYNHVETQEILQTFASGGNIITILATLISAIATACGIPFPYAIAFTIATALARLGVEIIRLLDHGMGIYFKIYHIEVFGTGILGFGYIWSQSETGSEGKTPEDNAAPEKCDEIIGKRNIIVGQKQSYKTKTNDLNSDLLTYIYDWGDGNYSISNWNDSDVEVSMSHSWEKEGTYCIRVKTFDIYGFESDWSEPLTVTITKSRERSRTIIFNIFERINQIFPLLQRILKIAT